MNLFKENRSKEISGEKLNTYNQKFYKIVNEQKCHHGLCYDLGEIIDPIEFNPTNSCSKPGGIYFTTIEHIFKFLDYGCFMCEIEIPNDSRCHIVDNNIKANKIIIKNMKHISDFDKWDDHDFCFKAIKQNENVFKYVKNQTEQLCLKAVKQNGDMLNFVKNQTEKICLTATRQNGVSLRYVENMTEEMCLEAVNRNGMSLQYIKNQTDQMCLIAINQNPKSLQFVNKQTREMCLDAVSHKCRNQMKYVLKLSDNKDNCLSLLIIKQKKYV